MHPKPYKLYKPYEGTGAQGHKAQGTGHRAQGTGHRAQGTGHRAAATPFAQAVNDNSESTACEQGIYLSMVLCNANCLYSQQQKTWCRHAHTVHPAAWSSCMNCVTLALAELSPSNTAPFCLHEVDICGQLCTLILCLTDSGRYPGEASPLRLRMIAGLSVDCLACTNPELQTI